ncbi:MAG: DNA mismatch repair endonuclease MutL [Candidatus Eremiobacteraeota bacterium]|nr:DNA mismatch repair endonuclease MutL [Candidatus Eremiobacteraeota bacterium]
MINVLDPVTIGQIAAGEVVERPLSVVKELVENAVDAGATRVSVAIEQGGLQRIEVTDDGRGIPHSQLPLAARRHTTSKLAQSHDLESVGTLGFRGEGLASIASVARVRIISRTLGDQVGARVDAHAEEIGSVEPTPAPVGTTVSAEALFENLPVRREYLRSHTAEFNRISAWLSTFALAYPQIAFSLTHDGKQTWSLPPSRDAAARLAAVFGKDAASALVPLDAGAAAGLAGTLSGYISNPGTDRADRRMQLLFVNGRLLRSSLLSGAWTAGYSTFAMIGRQPFGVLFLQLPPEHVDPNVHPTKSDVRLRFSHQVFDAVRRAISTTLHARATSSFRDAVSLGPGGRDAGLPHLQSLFGDALGSHQHPEEFGGGARLRVLAQLDATYILGTDGQGLMLVDQHAAHERIAYERIVAASQDRAPSEPMLVAHTVELSASQSAALERVLEILGEGGLQIEHFGERSYRITATPAGYGSRSFDLAGFLEDLSEDPKQRDVRERVWASLACHSVTRAGERLEFAEMTSLVERLMNCENPMHCPHGRPTIVRLDPDAIARLFKRI